MSIQSFHDTWRVVSSRGDKELTRLLRAGEPTTTVLSEKLLRGSLDGRLRGGGRFYHDGDAAVFHSPGGMFYPYALEDDHARRRGLRRSIGDTGSVYSIMGTPNDVKQMATTLGAVARTNVEYHLLALESASFAAVDPPPGLGLRVVRPRRGDWRRLLPLHIAYETEEVLLPGQRLNPNVSRSSLIESLAHQLVLVALRGNEPVARVATNARGFRNDQIGGVYTVPDLRGRGVARWLMGCLLTYIAADSHGASLFVKTHNEAALKLYDTLGFTFVCPFRIGYFR